MNKIIPLILTLLLVLPVALARTETVLVTEFKIDKSNQIEITAMRLEKGIPTIGGGTYSISTYQDNNPLSKINFEPKFSAWADPEEEVDPNAIFPYPEGEQNSLEKFGEIEQEEVTLLLRLPYKEDTNKLIIQKDNAQIFEKEINLCNQDKTCQITEGENYLSCEEDCPSGSKDDLCDEAYDDICDPDCKFQGREDKDPDCTCGNGICDTREDPIVCEADCGKPSPPFFWWIIGGVVGAIAILVLIIVGIVMLIKKIKNKNQTA